MKYALPQQDNIIAAKRLQSAFSMVSMRFSYKPFINTRCTMFVA
jgi:hypothetical protein